MITHSYLIMIKKDNQSQPTDYADQRIRHPDLHCYHDTLGSHHKSA